MSEACRAYRLLIGHPTDSTDLPALIWTATLVAAANPMLCCDNIHCGKRIDVSRHILREIGLEEAE